MLPGWTCTGRLWLISPYCDVAEPWSESKGAPWLYRDWVVRALNDDMGYDVFVKKQLAADLMPDADRADRAALGFIGLSPTYWKELKLAPEVIKTVVADEWEERIDTMSSTFLGLTVACARCHDHKFDPITQKDYYALAGVLASIREKDVRIGPGDMMAPGVEDASLHVLPDGPHKTKLDYRPGVPQDVALQVRGNPSNPGPIVPRRFLAVLSPAPGADAPGSPTKPFTQGSGRLALAGALVHEGAPLLAQWHYGLGRSVAWTSDVGGRWSAGWTSWDQNTRFWEQLMRWAMGPPINRDFRVEVSRSGNEALVRVEDIQDGRFGDLQALIGDQRLIGGRLGLGRCQFRFDLGRPGHCLEVPLALGEQCCPQCRDVVGEAPGRRHETDYRRSSTLLRVSTIG